MAGISFRIEVDEASLTGYFNLKGRVSVLGLITASLELALELRYVGVAFVRLPGWPAGSPYIVKFDGDLRQVTPL